MWITLQKDGLVNRFKSLLTLSWQWTGFCLIGATIMTKLKYCFNDNLLCRLFNKEELLAFTSTLLTQTFQNLLGVGLFIYCNDFFLLLDKSSVVFLGFLYLQVLYLILQTLVQVYWGLTQNVALCWYSDLISHTQTQTHTHTHTHTHTQTHT